MRKSAALSEELSNIHLRTLFRVAKHAKLHAWWNWWLTDSLAQHHETIWIIPEKINLFLVAGLVTRQDFCVYHFLYCMRHEHEYLHVTWKHINYFVQTFDNQKVLILSHICIVLPVKNVQMSFCVLFVFVVFYGFNINGTWFDILFSNTMKYGLSVQIFFEITIWSKEMYNICKYLLFTLYYWVWISKPAHQQWVQHSGHTSATGLSNPRCSIQWRQYPPDELCQFFWWLSVKKGSHYCYNSDHHSCGLSFSV